MRSLDRDVVGPVMKAYRHARLAETLLLHLKFVSRNHPRFRQQGIWAVVIGTTVIRRKSYWFKAINKPPFRWANRVLRLHAEGVNAKEQIPVRRGFERAAEQSPAGQPGYCAATELDVTAFHFCREQRVRGSGGEAGAGGQAPLLSRVAERAAAREEVDPDYRPTRFRSVVNYFLPPQYDELPAKLFPVRYHTIDGWLKRARPRGPKRRG